MVGAEWTGWLQRCRESRRLILVIVAIALLLDNMLLTAVGKWKLGILGVSGGKREQREEARRARARRSHFPAIRLVPFAAAR